MKPFFFITGPAWGMTTRGGHTGHEITTPFIIKSNGERGRLAWPLRKDDTHKSRKYETFFFFYALGQATQKTEPAWAGHGTGRAQRPLRKDDTHKSRKYETFLFLFFYNGACMGHNNTRRAHRA